MTSVTSSELAADPQHSRATIIAELARVLRDSDASTTNIESAIARTSVSMQQVCAQFGGKRELILAMVSQLSDSMSAPLSVGSAKPDLRQRLLEFGQRVTDICATSHLRSLYRIAITESIRHTGLGRDFHEVGPGRLTQRLADFLQIAQTQGVLGCADPHLLASHFLSPLQALDNFAISPIASGTYVRNVVDLFCDGIKAGRQPC